MTMHDYFELMAERNASDLVLSVGARPAMKVDGDMHALDEAPVDSARMNALVGEVLDATQRAAFETQHERSLTLSHGDLGRFRLNLYRQRGESAIAVRFVPHVIPGFEELHLPEVLKELVTLPRGLILVVGAAGSGKSTTLAAMIDYRNHHRSGHILSIEDPIEYLHAHDKSVVDQREVGTDTDSLQAALRNALRESPDVIVIGEIRDRAAMEGALAFASTGHLCIATLHAVNASQALDSVLRFFTPDARDHVLFELSTHLKAVVSQRLLRAANGGRRLPAFEVMLQSTHVSELIAKGDVLRLQEAIKQGADEGMITFEDSLLRLYRNRQITLHEALAQADSVADLKLRVRVSEPLTLSPRGEAEVAMRLVEQPAPSERPATDTRLRYGPR